MSKRIDSEVKRGPDLDEENGRESHENVDDGNSEGNVWANVWESLCQDIVAIVENF